jgi:hypothetical protein
LARVWHEESHCIAAGVHGLATSASTITVIFPPGVGLAAVVVVGATVVFVLPAVVAVAAAVVLVPPVVVGLVLLLSPPHAAATKPALTRLMAIKVPGRFATRRGVWCTLRLPLSVFTDHLDRPASAVV